MIPPHTDHIDDAMKTRGFTILEILVVISIIAIMIGIAGPRVKGMRDEGNVSKAKRELKTLQAAVESYRSNHANTNPNGITTDLTGAFPQIISAVLTDPFSAAGYRYSVSGTSYYAISSVGANGVNETAAIQASGNVPSSGDDIVATNGTITTLNLTSDNSNCGIIGTACDQGSGETCTNGACTSALAADGAACTANNECASNACGGYPKVCRAVIENLANGVACTQNSDCASSYCQWNPAQETTLCGTGADGTPCFWGGSNCQGGFCNTINEGASCSNGENGANCDSPNECKSGWCNGGACWPT